MLATILVLDAPSLHALLAHSLVIYSWNYNGLCVVTVTSLFVGAENVMCPLHNNVTLNLLAGKKSEVPTSEFREKIADSETYS